MMCLHFHMYTHSSEQHVENKMSRISCFIYMAIWIFFIPSYFLSNPNKIICDNLSKDNSQKALYQWKMAILELNSQKTIKICKIKISIYSRKQLTQTQIKERTPTHFLCPENRTQLKLC